MALDLLFFSCTKTVTQQEPKSQKHYARISTGSIVEIDTSEARVQLEGKREAPEKVEIKKDYIRWKDTKGKAADLNGERRIVISKSKHALKLFIGDAVVGEYLVGFGLNPVNDKLQEGDYCTPEGTFRVVSKHPSKKAYKSLCLDYPTGDSLKKIRRAKSLGIKLDNPPGKNICIHGRVNNIPVVTKTGDAKTIHNWTWGCAALDNPAMDQVYDFADIGDKVVIKWK